MTEPTPESVPYAYSGLVPRTDLPFDQAWEDRMQARRDLKERIFLYAYGHNPAGHAYAADEMAKFNAETLRLFPDRFREPTKEELAKRAEFASLIQSLSTPVARARNDSESATTDDFREHLKGWARKHLGIELTDAQMKYAHAASVVPAPRESITGQPWLVPQSDAAIGEIDWAEIGVSRDTPPTAKLRKALEVYDASKGWPTPEYVIEAARELLAEQDAERTRNDTPRDLSTDPVVQRHNANVARSVGYLPPGAF